MKQSDESRRIAVVNRQACFHLRLCRILAERKVKEDGGQYACAG